MGKDIFDKLHVAYRVFIIIVLIAAAMSGVFFVSSQAHANSDATQAPMLWPPDMVPHPHPPEPPPTPRPPGGPMV